MCQEIAGLFIAMAIVMRENQSHASDQSKKIGKSTGSRDAVEVTKGNESSQDLTTGIYATIEYSFLQSAPGESKNGKYSWLSMVLGNI